MARSLEQFKQALVIFPLLSFALAGCAAAAESVDESTDATQAAIQIGPDGKALNFFYCAAENGTCLLGNTPQYVAFGAEGRWAFMVKSGSFSCDPATFGRDPWEGHAKDCYYAPYTPEASEGQYLTAPGDFSFGTDGWFTFLTELPGDPPLQCSRDVFGDPIPGRPESCMRANPGFEWVASENHNFNASGNVPVAFGADGFYRYQVLPAGMYSCVKATFGNVDPIPGVQKRCYQLEGFFAADEGGSFIKGSAYRKVLFGSGINGRFLESAASSGQCTRQFFGGDPAPGTQKHCYLLP